MMKKRIISVLLALATTLTMVAAPAAAIDRKDSSSAKLAKLLDGSHDMFDIGEVMSGFAKLNGVLYNLTRLDCFSPEVYAITVDSAAQQLIDNVLADTDVDFGSIVKYFPLTDRVTSKYTAAIGIDMAALRDQLIDAAAKARQEGRDAQADILIPLAIIVGEIDTCEVKCVPDGETEGMYRLVADVVYKDGKAERLNPGIYYDEKNNVICGKDGEPAVLGFYMDFNQNISYTGTNTWQRKAGFCLFYDLFCYATPYLMNYNTQRIKFDYDNREWMIQIWKGTYFITNGAEVGIYTRKKGSVGSFYNCAGDEDMLVMSVALYHGDDLIFERDAMRHWWMTGFSVSDTAYLPCTLTLMSTITFRDEEMRDAFLASLKKNRAIKHETDGLNVTIVW